MNKKYQLHVAKVKPVWLRFLILVIIGLPPITGWPLTLFATAKDPLHNLFMWLSYGCFIWLFILLNTGFKKLLSYLSFAFLLALITCLVGAGIRNLIGFIQGASRQDMTLVSIRMLSLFICMVSVIPYSLFFINCFSVSSFISRLDFSTVKNHRTKIHLALALRVFQHVGDVTISLLDVWREENPKMISPRFSDELWESRLSPLAWLNWMRNSAVTWCLAMIMHTFEAIPYLTEEMKNIINFRENR
ncbi:hypothetical protein [Mucilaginibacter aquatilis]|uniref:Uncharacterized protein n=1 Tax=Mucilaginibacter aquatilis TaxID=1517760 RepID=A0A6I4I947_9SPHI|nr:hypothetical protein [Mucilaginibacter aquatilis]MVN91467.1 hypothetical protein [Mucilaginibacter aquatilis]